MSKENYVCLSDFLEMTRPLKRDLYNIYRAVFEKVTTSERCNDIVFHIEYIYYDRINEKVSFRYIKGNNMNAISQIDNFLNYMVVATRYAGSESNTFAKEFLDAYRQEDGIKKCLFILNQYEKDIKYYRKSVTVIDVLFVLVMILFELIYCLIKMD